jgi:intracellular multiplication protein IcmV
LFTVAKPERRETFEEAVVRYNLSENDIQARQKAFFQVAMLYLAGFVLDILYVIYLYATQRHMPAVMALAFSGVLFSMFFRQHFWYTQMKHRRLGFTFQQWVFSLFK